MELLSTIVEAIYSYTGLSPVAFFTILSLMVGSYYVVCRMFVSPEEAAVAAARNLAPLDPAIPADSVQVGKVTVEELRDYDGSDPKKPLLMAIKGSIYDVSRSRFIWHY